MGPSDVAKQCITASATSISDRQPTSNGFNFRNQSLSSRSYCRYVIGALLSNRGKQSTHPGLGLKYIPCIHFLSFGEIIEFLEEIVEMKVKILKLS